MNGRFMRDAISDPDCGMPSRFSPARQRVSRRQNSPATTPPMEWPNTPTRSRSARRFSSPAMPPDARANWSSANFVSATHLSMTALVFVTPFSEYVENALSQAAGRIEHRRNRTVGLPDGHCLVGVCDAQHDVAVARQILEQRGVGTHQPGIAVRK